MTSESKVTLSQYRPSLYYYYLINFGKDIEIFEKFKSNFRRNLEKFEDLFKLKNISRKH